MFANLDYTFYIKSVVPSIGTIKIFTCNTLNLHTGKVVNINGVDYEIIDFSLNDFIEVEGVTPITVDSFQVDPLFFEWGTLLDTNQFRAGKKQINEQRVPFAWLRTPYSSELGNYESTFDETASLVLYLQDHSLLMDAGLRVGDNWDSQRHEEWIIEPLKNLFRSRVEKYIENNQGIFGEVPNYTLRGMALTGVESSEGYSSALFDEKLSGIEVRIDLEFLKQGCEC